MHSRLSPCVQSALMRCVPLVVSTLETHKAHQGVASNGIGCLYNLAMHPVNAPQMRRMGVAAVVTSVMARHRTDFTISGQGSAILEDIAA
jgi:hypothetical protein